MRFLKFRQAYLTFSCVLATVFLAGCAKENAFDCVKSTGKIVTETRELPEFNAIKVFDNLEVWLVPDTVYFAEVTCGEHLQENVLTEVKNGTLWLQNINKCNWVRSYEKPMKVRVHLPVLETIFHDGFGTIRSEGKLKGTTLFLHVTGAGDLDLEVNTESIWLDMYELGNIKLTGKSTKLLGNNMSSGKLDAANLNTEESYIKITGDGNASVHASHSVNATITGRGNVFYSGFPAQVSRDGNGTGQLIKTN